MQVALMLLSQHRRNRNLPSKSPKHLHPRINRDGIGEEAEVVRKIRGATRTRTVVMADKTKLAITKSEISTKANPFKRVKKSQINDYKRLPVGGRLVCFRKC